MTQSPPDHTLEQLPIITLDDYSLHSTPQGISSKDSSMVESTSFQPLLHFSNPPSGDSDSEMSYPPSSVITSEMSSAAASESDLPSPAISDSDLPLQSKVKESKPRVQTGIQNFFRVLSEAEIKAQQAKRKRADSDDEALLAERVRKKKERKAADKRERNRLSQQKCREKLKKVEIKKGIRDSDGKLVQVS
jgi:hypothetical protein